MKATTISKIPVKGEILKIKSTIIRNFIILKVSVRSPLILLSNSLSKFPSSVYVSVCECVCVCVYACVTVIVYTVLLFF